MPDPFSPSFKKFQADIEAYITAQGNREKTKDGFIVFHGYADALTFMFDRYLAEQALEPLVTHFRAWNWEYSYNDYLLRLTDALLVRRDWPLLKDLWSGVISKRRRLYNDIRRLERKVPGSVSAESVKNSKEKLLEALDQVRSMCESVGTLDDAKAYDLMISKVKAGRMA